MGLIDEKTVKANIYPSYDAPARTIKKKEVQALP
jgi:hypothetical protein